MHKALSEIIAEKQAAKEPNESTRNRAAFIANLEEIRQALKDGWSRKIIWETLKEQGKIPFAYDAFLRYVRPIMENPATGGTAILEPEVKKPKDVIAPEKETESRKIGEFTYDPVPNLEELY